jgi:hypothetical protein
MFVAEVLTGIALVQQSVKFIKENISTVQDIGQIANQIDDLYSLVKSRCSKPELKSLVVA